MSDKLRLTLKNGGRVWQDAAAAIVILRGEARQESHTHTHWDEKNDISYDFKGDYMSLRAAALKFFAANAPEFPEASVVDKQGTARREVVINFARMPAI